MSSDTDETTTSPTMAVTRRVTVAEAAEALAVCEETVRRLIRRGRVPAVRVGVTYRLRLAEVEAALAVNTHAA